MNSRKVVHRVALCVGLLCGISSGALAETLKVGIIGPLTGGGAPWGNAAAEAVRILASEVNSRGGLDVGGKKYQVEVIAYDDQYKAADAVSAYNRLVTRDGVRYIMAVTSPATIALGQSVEDDKVIFLSTAGAEKAVDPKSKYMFRMMSLLRDYVPPMIAWVKEHAAGRRVVVVNPNDESGWASTELTKGVYLKSGFDVVDSPLFERSQKDFQPMLTKVIALKPDIIELASTSPATAGIIVRQARELGYKGIFVKDSGAATREIIESAGKEGAEGAISLHFADPTNDGYKRLAEAYKKKFGQQADDLIVIYYDAANAMLRAIEKSGDVNDTTKVSEAFLNKVFPFPSVQGGELSLGGGGQPGDPNQIMTWSYLSIIKDGAPVISGKVK